MLETKFHPHAPTPYPDFGDDDNNTTPSIFMLIAPIILFIIISVGSCVWVPLYMLCILSNLINIPSLSLPTPTLTLATTTMTGIAFNSTAFGLDYFRNSSLNRMGRFLYNEYASCNKWTVQCFYLFLLTLTLLIAITTV